MSLSVLIPTRNRAAYLAAALASVREQHDGEIVVVVDGPRDEATERVAGDHGATVVTLGAHEGINAARNRAVATATGDLLAFLDDDVTLWPTWRTALEAAGDAECLAGPIHPRLEGPAPRGCGRPQDAPVTAHDGTGPFGWGANFAIRRSAFERVGPFDEAINHCGDEEDWQRRLKAAGGRVENVPGYGVEHRRTGDDARLRNLARGAYHRGRAARGYDVRKGTAPPLRHELRVLAGLLAHVVRKRCPAGLVPVAREVGRLRATWPSR